MNKKTLSHFLRNFFNPANVGVFILLAAVVWSFAFYDSRMKLSQGTIAVTGVAYQDVEADRADWSVEIEVTAADRKESYRKLLDEEKKLRRFLISQGFKEEKLPTPSYKTFPVYKKINEYTVDENEILGHRSIVGYWFSTHEIEKVSNAATALPVFAIDNDITVTNNQASYLYTKLESLKISLLENAIKNAKERARAISKVSGQRIGKITNADQGTFQINAYGDTSISDYGNLDTSSIHKTVRALANVEFAVE